MNQDINNSAQLRKIKNYLFSGKNKELDCYTALGFKNGDNLIKRRRESKLAIEKKLKKINKQSPSNEDYIDKGIEKESLSFIVDLKRGAQSYIANLQKEENSKGNNDIAKMTEDKNSNLHRFKCTLDYIEQVEKSLGFSLNESLEETSDKFFLLEQKEKLEKQYEDKTKISNSKKKPLGLSVESYNLLSKIREDSVKILSNSSLRSAYDEGVKKGELKPLASYEECLKYQQKASEKNINDTEELIIKEKINDEPQIESTQKEDIHSNAENNVKVSRLFSQYMQQSNINNLSPINQTKGQKLGNGITLLLPIYAKPIDDIFGIKGLTSIITELSRSGINIKTEANGIIALENSPRSLKQSSENCEQDIQKIQDNQKEVTAKVADNSTSSWQLFGSIGNMVNNAKNWCYNITEQMINFTNTKLKSSALYPNLNVDNSSEPEHGTPGKYRMTITEVNTHQSKEQTSSKLNEVTIQPHCSQNSKTFQLINCL